MKLGTSAIIGGLLFALAIFVGLFAPWLAHTDPVMGANLMNAEEPPSWVWWFGTDAQGRDIYSRVVHGARGMVAGPHHESRRVFVRFANNKGNVGCFVTDLCRTWPPPPLPGRLCYDGHRLHDRAAELLHQARHEERLVGHGLPQLLLAATHRLDIRMQVVERHGGGPRHGGRKPNGTVKL